MSALPEALYTASQVRELEQRAIEAHGIAADKLMQRAGDAAWQLLGTHWPGSKHLLVLCGTGNNAGDGYVLATHARKDKRQVSVLTLGEREHLPAAAAHMRERFLKAGGKEQPFRGELPEADVTVDALLGTGVDRPLQGEWLQLAEAVNRSGAPVLSLDIPSGLNADTGAAMGAAVRAAVTITYIGLKAGLFTGAGPECVGLLRFDDLAVPEAVYQGVEASARRMRSTTPPDAELPRRARNAHKGDYGHLLVVGGDKGMGGAVRLAAEAALRSGAGLVSIVTRSRHVSGLLAGLPEAMTHAVETPEELAKLLGRATVVCIGPGLGRSAWGKALLEPVLASALPLVADADALNFIAAAPQKRGRWIFTPHPGEAARLLGTRSQAVQANRYTSAESIVSRYDAITVLKGAGSLVAAPGELTAVCTAGNPGMAAPGMGDVLTGVIGALVAQGLSLPQAARAGVCLHAAAGDLAARQGERGLMARDVIDALRRVVNP
jgi:hydroxyethylthiazole kinase-like uncharacterized protein yjeF